ncbi:DUF6498-containing protein [Pseudorhodoplanes sp.]|uniref:DUF6498-containing protein n=1 Tax=Pseudorhodoplanes sp. TaxID=1934341 RepID=UPI003D0CB513
MANLIIFAANLLPLAGVWFWGWDAFQVLMLYWAETVIVALWTLARIATMPDPDGRNGTGRIIINAGKTVFFALHAGIFIGVHLVFLLTLFSGDWESRMDHPLGFLDALYIESGAWVALVLAFVAGLIGFVTATPQPTVVTWFLSRIGGRRASFVPEKTDPDKDHLNPVISGLYTRIIVMQVGIIFGAWLTDIFGNLGPLVIVIVLKSVIELGIWTPWKPTVEKNAKSGDRPAQ